MGCRRAKCGTGGPSSQKRACSRANTAVFITSSFPLHPWVPLRLLISLERNTENSNHVTEAFCPQISAVLSQPSKQV